MRDWGIFIKEYPVVLGSDAAGKIAAVGDKVTGFKQGDRVFFQGIIGTQDGATFQEYAKMPAELVGHTPTNVSDDEAAGISLATVAVLTAYYHQSGLAISPAPWQKGGGQFGKGKSIVILGGSSSVGQFAIQLARLSGFDTIVTGSSKAHHEHLKQLGATHVLDRSKASPADYAKTATSNGQTLSWVFDTIAQVSTHMEGVSILQTVNKTGSDAGSTVVTVYTPEKQVEEAAKAGGAVKNGEEVALKTVWGIGSNPDLRPIVHGFMQAAGGQQGWLANKQYFGNRPLVIDGGLEALDEAMDKNRDGVSGQKIVVNPTKA
jgi:D-arabinose 1-dehydrogenase-like Zn-dependent alcohol dehydrogenase